MSDSVGGARMPSEQPHTDATLPELTRCPHGRTGLCKDCPLLSDTCPGIKIASANANANLDESSRAIKAMAGRRKTDHQTDSAIGVVPPAMEPHK